LSSKSLNLQAIERRNTEVMVKKTLDEVSAHKTRILAPSDSFSAAKSLAKSRGNMAAVPLQLLQASGYDVFRLLVNGSANPVRNQRKLFGRRKEENDFQKGQMRRVVE
jgi:hypothetical protein